ncbi:hypothetical protein KK449_07565 [Clostridioides difficile]|nr:hypothetical protein [Clostridioides difficile]MBT2157004.1 hypothetical protein [Clostridioides difficile]MBT2157023.1 hypothetical protein [Clostridioides difficile]MBT2158550.1 hypothetical protein [Clostridioides difficile]MBT2159250.1 hypothetical protein [Clostridioides difficile]
MKTKIIGGRENECPICNGNIFKIETLIGIVWQCKDCGCMYQDMSSKESKRGIKDELCYKV